MSQNNIKTICSGITSTGAPCKAKGSIEVDGVFYCKAHALSPVAAPEPVYAPTASTWLRSQFLKPGFGIVPDQDSGIASIICDNTLDSHDLAFSSMWSSPVIVAMEQDKNENGLKTGKHKLNIYPVSVGGTWEEKANAINAAEGKCNRIAKEGGKASLLHSLSTWGDTADALQFQSHTSETETTLDDMQALNKALSTVSLYVGGTATIRTKDGGKVHTLPCARTKRIAPAPKTIGDRVEECRVQLFKMASHLREVSRFGGDVFSVSVSLKYASKIATINKVYAKFGIREIDHDAFVLSCIEETEG